MNKRIHRSVLFAIQKAINSEVPCRVCKHAKKHDASEEEDTHWRCSNIRKVRYGCDDHARFNRRCFDAEMGCWIGAEACQCSAEERLIADLMAQIAGLTEVA